MKSIVIFASGTGTNAEAIINHFKDRQNVQIPLILSNNKEARVLRMAESKNIPTHHFSREDFYDTSRVIDLLQELQPDLIVLAGFLWIIPETMIAAFPNKIINIHPSLLPKFGGKGMYGNRVHQAVLENREKETGISIHYVNEQYDDGEIIAQFKTDLNVNDGLEEIISKIRILEHGNYAQVIDQLLFPEIHG